MRKLLFTMLLACLQLCAWSQTPGMTKYTIQWKDYRPAIVTTTDGKKVTVGQANILLKRSTLVYRSVLRNHIMEAQMDNIKCVDFGDRHYERIDTTLAWRVDTVGKNALYCVTKIDQHAFRQNLINNRQMTNVELNTEYVETATLDPADSDIEYPVVNIYYYYLNGKFVLCHERELYRHVPKAMRERYKVALSMPDFSWSSPKSLLNVLRSITR